MKQSFNSTMRRVFLALVLFGCSLQLNAQSKFPLIIDPGLIVPVDPVSSNRIVFNLGQGFVQYYEDNQAVQGASLISGTVTFNIKWGTQVIVRTPAAVYLENIPSGPVFNGGEGYGGTFYYRSDRWKYADKQEGSCFPLSSFVDYNPWTDSPLSNSDGGLSLNTRVAGSYSLTYFPYSNEEEIISSGTGSSPTGCYVQYVRRYLVQGSAGATINIVVGDRIISDMSEIPLVMTRTSARDEFCDGEGMQTVYNKVSIDSLKNRYPDLNFSEIMLEGSARRNEDGTLDDSWVKPYREEPYPYKNNAVIKVDPSQATTLTNTVNYHVTGNTPYGPAAIVITSSRGYSPLYIIPTSGGNNNQSSQNVTILSAPAMPQVQVKRGFAGQNTKLTVTNPANGVEYKWYKNGAYTGVAGTVYEFVTSASAETCYAVAGNANQCTKQSNSINITPFPAPALAGETVSAPAVCFGQKGTITVSGCQVGATYVLYSKATGAEIGRKTIAAGDTAFSIPNLDAGKYKVSAIFSDENDHTQTIDIFAEVDVTIHPAVNIQTAYTPGFANRLAQTQSSSEPVMYRTNLYIPNPTQGVAYNWYYANGSAPDYTRGIGAGASVDIFPVETTRVIVVAANSFGCETIGTAFDVIPAPRPVAMGETADAPIACNSSNSSVTLSSCQANAVYKIVNNTSGNTMENGSINGNSITFTDVPAGSYRVEATFADALNQLYTITPVNYMEVISHPAVTATVSPVSRCGVGEVTLTASNVSGGDGTYQYEWYDADENVVKAKSAETAYTFNASESGTYYVKVFSSVCESELIEAGVTVNPFEDIVLKSTGYMSAADSRPYDLNRMILRGSTNGTWSGPHVSNNKFHGLYAIPDSLYTLTYTYTTPEGCVTTKTATFATNPEIHNWRTIPTPCALATTTNLSTTIGFTDTYKNRVFYYVDENGTEHECSNKTTINPSVLGAGTYVIRCKYQNKNDVDFTAENSITIKAVSEALPFNNTIYACPNTTQILSVQSSSPVTYFTWFDEQGNVVKRNSKSFETDTLRSSIVIKAVETNQISCSKKEYIYNINVEPAPVNPDIAYQPTVHITDPDDEITFSLNNPDDFVDYEFLWLDEETSMAYYDAEISITNGGEGWHTMSFYLQSKSEAGCLYVFTCTYEVVYVNSYSSSTSSLSVKKVNRPTYKSMTSLGKIDIKEKIAEIKAKREKDKAAKVAAEAITTPTSASSNDTSASSAFLVKDDFPGEYNLLVNSKSTQEAVLSITAYSGSVSYQVKVYLKEGENMIQLPSDRIPFGAFLVSIKCLETGEYLVKKGSRNSF